MVIASAAAAVDRASRRLDLRDAKPEPQALLGSRDVDEHDVARLEPHGRAAKLDGLRARHDAAGVARSATTLGGPARDFR